MAWYDLSDLLMKVPLEEVISRLGIKVERRGHQLRALCPFHQDSNPSLNIYPPANGLPSHYHCFACGAHGNAIDLVKEVNGGDFASSVDWLARNFGIQPARGKSRGELSRLGAPSPLKFALKQFDINHDSDKFLAWCRHRGFDADFLYRKGFRLIAGPVLVPALKELSVGDQVEVADGLLELGLIRRLRSISTTGQLKLKLDDQYQDYFNDGRVVIPVYDSLQHGSGVVGFAGRTLDESENKPVSKYLLTAGFKKSAYLFNAKSAFKMVVEELKAGGSSTLYLVEGFLDAMRLESLGYHAVALMGTSLGEGQFEQITSFVSALPANAHPLIISVFLDNDAAGFDGADRLVRDLLGVVGVDLRWVGTPWRTKTDIGKDPDSCLLGTAGAENASAWLRSYDLPAEAVLVSASLGGKDSSALHDAEWSRLSPIVRERALYRAAVAIRRFSGSRSLDVTVDRISEVESDWARELARVVRGEDAALPAGKGGAYLHGVYERTALARNLAYFGARRGELPCDEEAWLTLGGNARLFDQIALDRLQNLIQGKDSHWRQAAPFDAVNLPRKLSGDERVLNDPRRKVMPHPADLHAQQIVLNEILTQRHDRLNAAGRTFSACIPAVRWYSSRAEVVVTGPYSALSEPNLHAGEPATLSFGYQIDMDVLEGDKTPSDQGMFRPFGECWRDFMTCLSQQCHAIGSQVHVLRLDAKRYYDNVQRYVVRDRLLAPLIAEFNSAGVPVGFSEVLGLVEGSHQDAGFGAVERLIMGFLFGFSSRDPAREGDFDWSSEAIGIPQGPVISAYIGTIALFPVDDCARKFIRRTSKLGEDGAYRPTAGYARYVDDIVIFADSDQALAEMREALQSEAGLSSISLIHKGDRVRAGSPDAVMQQLNEGRGFAASVPGWEPPLVGDGEAGWGLAQDMPAVDRQCALGMLRHPDLITNPSGISAQVRAAMAAQDLRPNDLGLCARWLWWQVASESDDLFDHSSREIWLRFWALWESVCEGRDWSAAFERRGYYWLYAVEGLDRLLDPNPWIENGQALLEVPKNRALRKALAEVVCRADFFIELPAVENRSHLLRRSRLIVTKARRLGGTESLRTPIDAHRADSITSVEWLCIAAEALNSSEIVSDDAVGHPLSELRGRTQEAAAPTIGLRLADAVRRMLEGAKDVGLESRESEVLGFSIDFVLNSAPKRSGVEVLERFPNLLLESVNSKNTVLVPHLPIADERASSLYALEGPNLSGRRCLIVYTVPPLPRGSRDFVGVELEEGSGARRSVSRFEFRIVDSTSKLLGMERSAGDVPWEILNPADLSSLGTPIQAATILFDALYAIHLEEGHIDSTVYVPFKPQLVKEDSDGGRVIHVLAEPVARELLGINAWFHDQDGRVRTISVPKVNADIWRVGWAVADVLGLAAGMAGEVGMREEILASDFIEGPSSDQIAELIEGYVLRQQLRKLQGSYISEAQVDVSGAGGGRGDVPRTVSRALDLLRGFPAEENLASKVRYVIASEAETRAMALRLTHRSVIDLRNQLHLIFPEAMGRLPLWVLQGLDLRAPDTDSEGVRPELLLLTSLYNAMRDSADFLPRNGQPDCSPPLRTALALSVATYGLRGCVAALWGLTQGSRSRIRERLVLPLGWFIPDGLRADPEADFMAIRTWLINSDWAALGRATPWHWMLALVGILDSSFPRVLQEQELARVFSVLGTWTHGQSVPEQSTASAEDVWPFDGLPTMSVLACNALVDSVSAAVRAVDRLLGLEVVRVEHARFDRSRSTDEFTDASGTGWQMSKPQYTSLGPGDVERLVRDRQRLSAWTETRIKATGELVSVHWLGSKLGSWLATRGESRVQGLPTPVVRRSADSLPEEMVRLQGLRETATADADLRNDSAIYAEALDRADAERVPGGLTGPESLKELRRLQMLSLAERRRAQRGDVPSNARASSHFRVALLQWQSQDSYSHPLAEVGIDGLPFGQGTRDDLASILDGGDLCRVRAAASRGSEHLWMDEMDLISWPEHRRRAVLTEALHACHSLGVELLVLPEVSIRKDTVAWMKRELTLHYPGLSVLAGTYRNFTSTVDSEHLKEILTLLWRPESDLVSQLGLDLRSPTIELSRGKKYRSVAAHEFFKPDLRPLGPLYSDQSVLKEVSELRSSKRGWSNSDVGGLINALVNDSPKLRYCMELICSELFLLTSPANRRPLEQELKNMLALFSEDPTQAGVQVENDLLGVGDLLTFAHSRRERRSVLLVPAHTSRSNDYWHAGQASVLASGTATVFCNAVFGGANGESCFIGIDSVTRSKSFAGAVKLLTPYHGWQKGILQTDGHGALSSADQALVVVDMDPVHVVSGKPRPQLLPEPMALVAYMPIVEVIDSTQSKEGLAHALLASDGTVTRAPAPDEVPKIDRIKDLLGKAGFPPRGVHEKKRFAKAYEELVGAQAGADSDADYRRLVEKFAKHFGDPESLCERFNAWRRDRHQQPGLKASREGSEPAWVDFLIADLTCRGEVPSVHVPAWSSHGGDRANG